MGPVVSVIERMGVMEWRESGGRLVESGGERRGSVEGGESRVSGERGKSSNLARKEIGGVSVVSGERGGASGSSGERGGASGGRGEIGESRCLKRLKCIPNSLLSLSSPKFSKDKRSRRP